jgi:two-component system, OmpR family, response regulator
MPSPPVRVLVIDDNRDAADTLAVLLEIRGYACRAVYDAEDGLRAAVAGRPDCIVSDIGMPGLDGYEVARRVRAEPALAGVLLVALSGYADAHHVRLAAEAGFDHAFAKGEGPERLMRVLAASKGHPGPAGG